MFCQLPEFFCKTFAIQDPYILYLLAERFYQLLAGFYLPADPKGTSDKIVPRKVVGP